MYCSLQCISHRFDFLPSPKNFSYALPTIGNMSLVCIALPCSWNAQLEQVRVMHEAPYAAMRGTRSKGTLRPSVAPTPSSTWALPQPSFVRA